MCKALIVVHLPVDIMSRVSLIVADLIVMGVTWSVTHAHRRRCSVLRVYGAKKTLTSVMYRNGALLYIAICGFRAKTPVFVFVRWDLLHVRATLVTLRASADGGPGQLRQMSIPFGRLA